MQSQSDIANVMRLIEEEETYPDNDHPIPSEEDMEKIKQEIRLARKQANPGE